MDFGICVASKIDDVGYIARAENLGYSHAWVADSQMIWSDCYAVLALAAQQTRKIKIGTGVDSLQFLKAKWKLKLNIGCSISVMRKFFVIVKTVIFGTQA